MARKLLDQAKHLVAAGEVGQACTKMAESQRLDPRTTTELALADCHERAGRSATALVAFRELAAHATAAREAKLANTAKARADALEKKQAAVVVSVPEAASAKGLEVRLDGALLERDRWGSRVPVDPGAHRIEATAPGKKAFSASVDAQPGPSTATLVLTPLVDDAPPPVAPTPPPTKPAPRATAPTGTCRGDADCPGKLVCARAECVPPPAPPPDPAPKVASCKSREECFGGACVEGACATLEKTWEKRTTFLGALYQPAIGLSGPQRNPVGSHVVGLEIATGRLVRYHLGGGYVDLNRYQGIYLEPLTFGFAMPVTEGASRFEIEPLLTVIGGELLLGEATSGSLLSAAALQCVFARGGFYMSVAPIGIEVRYFTIVGNPKSAVVPEGMGVDYRFRMAMGFWL